MIRAVFSMMAIFAILLVIAELSLLGLLWTQGNLTAKTWKEIRMALSGQSQPEVVEVKEVKEQLAPSEEDIREMRVRRVLELESRENELTVLKRMTSETANRLISDRRAFDQLKEDFRNQLVQLQEQTASTATEQIRTVLLASPPEEAAKRLMGLSVAEGIDLLRGLPEKSIARILLAFQNDPKQVERGQLLFQGLYRGDPQRSVLEQALQQLNPEAANLAPSG